MEPIPQEGAQTNVRSTNKIDTTPKDLGRRRATEAARIARTQDRVTVIESLRLFRKRHGATAG